MSQVFGPIPPPPNTDTSSRGVKAVYIHCMGDRKILGLPKYTEVTISDSHVIFSREKPTDISVHMGIPLLTRKTGYVDPRWVDKRPGIDYACATSKDPMSNRKALYLNLRANLKQEQYWGFSDMEKWDTVIGTVLVARQDKKDITAHQVEGLARFCFYDLSPAMGELEEYIFEDYPKKSDRKKVREKFTKDFMCQAKFEECYEKLKAERVAAGKSSWATAVSPYSQI
ncbi:uncharacterized protein EAE98_002808 [Botrytis deweyae]|uniref:Uncharacterized protein n=1 Tax=Botrytis deweyae TaxID=2478750 RepID=A0ABQ7IUU7_9HELO|nr:uncharacterized protein EAE98_002808 [Botrytis deweyae]KAF7934763.1 hypothetical protein EAE98_002808 [Botrytis deweyae]